VSSDDCQQVDTNEVGSQKIFQKNRSRKARSTIDLAKGLTFTVCWGCPLLFWLILKHRSSSASFPIKTCWVVWRCLWYCTAKYFHCDESASPKSMCMCFAVSVGSLSTNNLFLSSCHSRAS